MNQKWRGVLGSGLAGLAGLLFLLPACADVVGAKFDGYTGAPDAGMASDQSRADPSETEPEEGGASHPARDGGHDSGSKAADAGTAGPSAPAVTCFEDADGDGFGDGTKQSQHPGSCPTGFTASTTFDCDDGNADVHPGQTQYFASGYVKGGALSFDYDCDGVETEKSPIANKASSSPGCAVGDNGCQPVGAGYVPTAPRAGAAPNLYCGSTTTERPPCETANNAFYCAQIHSTVQTTNAAAIRCR